MKKAVPTGLKNVEATTSGFVGFTAFGGGELASGTPFSPKVGTDIVYTGGDTELEVAMRKVGKKDETTKIKAMQDIVALLQARDKATIRGLLGPWCTSFTALALHNDRRVRAATFGVMESLVLAGMKKSFAPYLPAILPHWWVCCVDPAREVASLASTSLHALLGQHAPLLPGGHTGGESVAEALVQQLVTWLGQGPEEVSDMRLSSEEEAKDRCERVHSAALDGLGALLATAQEACTAPPVAAAESVEVQRATAEQTDAAVRALLTLLHPVLSGKSVWRHASSPSNATRRAVFRLAHSVATTAPQLMATQVRVAGLDSCDAPVLAPLPHVWRSVLPACVAEAHGGSQSAGWDAVLALVTAFPTGWGWAQTDEPAHAKAVMAAAGRSAALPLTRFTPLVPPPTGGGAPPACLSPASPPWECIWNGVLTSLKRSGYGSWTSLYPSLLPLLASVPARLLLCPEGRSSEDPSSVRSGGGGGKSGAQQQQRQGVGTTLGYQLLRSIWLGLRNGSTDEALPYAGQVVAVQSLGECASALLLASTRTGAEGCAPSPTWPTAQTLAHAAAGVHTALLLLAASTTGKDVRCHKSWPLAGMPEELLVTAEGVLADAGVGVVQRSGVLQGAVACLPRELGRLDGALCARGGEADSPLGRVLEALATTLTSALGCGALTGTLPLLQVGLQPLVKGGAREGGHPPPRVSAILRVFLSALGDRLEVALADSPSSGSDEALRALLKLHVAAVEGTGTELSKFCGRPSLLGTLSTCMARHACSEGGGEVLSALAEAYAHEAGLQSSKSRSISVYAACLDLSPRPAACPCAASSAVLTRVLRAIPARRGAAHVGEGDALSAWLRPRFLHSIRDGMQEDAGLLSAASHAGLMDFSLLDEAVATALGDYKQGAGPSNGALLLSLLASAPRDTVLGDTARDLVIAMLLSGAPTGGWQECGAAPSPLPACWLLLSDVQRNEVGFACQEAARAAVTAASAAGGTHQHAQAAATLLCLLRSMGTLTPPPLVWSWQAAWRSVGVAEPKVAAAKAEKSRWALLWAYLLQVQPGMITDKDLSTVLHVAPYSTPEERALQASVPVVTQHVAGLLRAWMAALWAGGRGTGAASEESMRVLLTFVGDADWPALLQHFPQGPQPEGVDVRLLTHALHAVQAVMRGYAPALQTATMLLTNGGRDDVGTALAVLSCLSCAGLHPLPPSLLWASVAGHADDACLERTVVLSSSEKAALLSTLEAAWLFYQSGARAGPAMWARVTSVALSALHRTGVSMEVAFSRTLSALHAAEAQMRVKGVEAHTSLALDSACAGLATFLCFDSARNVATAPSVLQAALGVLASHWKASLEEDEQTPLFVEGILAVTYLLARGNHLPSSFVCGEAEVLRRMAWMRATATVVRAVEKEDTILVLNGARAMKALVLCGSVHVEQGRRYRARGDDAVSAARAAAVAARERARAAEASGAQNEEEEEDGVDTGIDVEEVERLRAEATAAESALASVVSNSLHPTRGHDGVLLPEGGLHPSTLPLPPPPALLSLLLCAALNTYTGKSAGGTADVAVREVAQALTVLWGELPTLTHACPEAATALGRAVAPTFKASCSKLICDSATASTGTRDALLCLMERSAPLWSGVVASHGSPPLHVAPWSEYVKNFPGWISSAEDLSAAHVDGFRRAALQAAAPVEPVREVAAPTPQPAPAQEGPVSVAASLLSTVTSGLGWMASRWLGGAAQEAAPAVEAQEPAAGESSSAGAGEGAPAAPLPPAPPSPILPDWHDLPTYASLASTGGMPQSATGTTLQSALQGVFDAYDVILASLCVGTGKEAAHALHDAWSPSSPLYLDGALPTQEEASAELSRASTGSMLARGQAMLPPAIVSVLDPEEEPHIPTIVCLEAAIEVASNHHLGHSMPTAKPVTHYAHLFREAEVCLQAYVLTVGLLRSCPSSAADDLTQYLNHAGLPRKRDGRAVAGQPRGLDLGRALEACAHLLCTLEDGSTTLQQVAARAPSSCTLVTFSGQESVSSRGVRLAVLAKTLLLRSSDVLPVRVSEWGAGLGKTLAAEVAAYFARHVAGALFSYQWAQVTAALAEARPPVGTQPPASASLAAACAWLDLDAGSKLLPGGWMTGHTSGGGGHGTAILEGGCAGIGAYLQPKGPGSTPATDVAEVLRRTRDTLTVNMEEGSREIVAAYTHEEARVAVRLILPPNYPLKRPAVLPETRTGMSDGQWTRVELQLGQLITARDGALVDAVVFFASAVEKEFEGVEPCPICYCIVDPRTSRLPKTSCPTCRNCFHRTCLLRWFNTSKENKCPLCRQSFRQIVE